MNKLFAFLGLLSALLGLVFSFLPISNLAIFPAIFGFLLGIIALTIAKRKNQNFSFAKIVVILSLVAIVISVGKQLLIDNKVVVDTEFNQKTEKSKQDAVKDLEELENLDEELEDLE